ncbi:4-alpha-glucanotransferase [Micrococcales bacterium KH10]|nr:4-alpha-glucanotransferase [Micrococcales bacterium KH10]
MRTPRWSSGKIRAVEQPSSTQPASYDRLVALAEAYGIQTSYQGHSGDTNQVSPEALVAVLAVFEIDASTAASVEDALAETPNRPWRQPVPPTSIVREGHGRDIPVHLDHGDPVDVYIDLEDSTQRIQLQQRDVWVEPQYVDGKLIGRATFALPADLPLGYHTLIAQTPGRVHRGLVVVVPHRAPQPPETAWGVMTQLYSVRSKRSWGVGDFVDLADLAHLSHTAWGADFVLINPVHAVEPISPLTPSPYLPTSRRFISPWYIRVEEIREAAYLPAAERARLFDWTNYQSHNTPPDDVPHAAGSLTTGQVTPADGDDQTLIDRDTAWDAKLAALRAVFAVSRTPARQDAFDRFCQEHGKALDDFALWSTLYIHNEGRTWPQGFESPDTAASRQASRDHADEIEFHKWLQWIAFGQCAAAQHAARTAGMSIGIMQDLAVGVHPYGADAWSQQDVIASGVSVGAPPDMYNQLGQDWSQPPWRPDRLDATGYAAYRGMLRTVFRNAGAVRIDHIIGLFRLWWVPAGHGAKDGAYVRYDHEALVGILCLEAERAGVVVIGEDLGTFEHWVTDYLADRGILGTAVLWFESEWDGSPKHADHYRTSVLATVTTHDLPPTAGYLQCDHVQLREELGLLTVPMADELAHAQREIATMKQRLTEYGLLDSDESDGAGSNENIDEFVVALHQYLTRTPSQLLGVSLADMVGERRTQNQPGTDQEYPNWRIPLADRAGRQLCLEDIFGLDLATRIARVMPDSPHSVA